MPDIALLITHSGAFHADDLFAATVLSDLYPDARILRTRDPALLAETTRDRILFDVGNAYDPGRMIYDHHQNDRPLREDGLPYSGFGLVWRHHGADFLERMLPDLDPARQRELHARVDAVLVRAIDAGDNGCISPENAALLHPLAIGNIVERLNAMPHDPDLPDPGRLPGPEDHDAAFDRALAVSRPILKGAILSELARIESESILRDALGRRSDPRLVEVDRSLDPHEIVRKLETEAGTFEHEKTLYMIFPSAPAEWAALAIRRDTVSLDVRKPFPAEWAGKRDDALREASGVPDAIFCHGKRFFACAASREGALALARIAADTQTL